VVCILCSELRHLVGVLLNVVLVRLHLIQDILEANTSRSNYPWTELFISNVARGLLSGARHSLAWVAVSGGIRIVVRETPSRITEVLLYRSHYTGQSGYKE
jgi:hypothetical protein